MIFLIKVVEIKENKKIVFKWGLLEEEHVVTMLDHSSTIIEVNEEGFNEDNAELIPKLIDNKDGWVFM